MSGYDEWLHSEYTNPDSDCSENPECYTCWDTCETCDEHGEINGMTCQDCFGEGKIWDPNAQHDPEDN